MIQTLCDYTRGLQTGVFRWGGRDEVAKGMKTDRLR